MAKKALASPIVRELIKRSLRIVHKGGVFGTSAKIFYIIAMIALPTVACDTDEKPATYRSNNRDAESTTSPSHFEPFDPQYDASAISDADDDSANEPVSTEDIFSVDVSDDDLFTDAQGYCLAAAANTFALAYQNHAPGTDCRTRIDFLLIPSLGPLPEPETVVNRDFNCSIPREPALVLVDETWQMVWTDTRSFESDAPDYEANLYSMVLGIDDSKMAITLDALSEQDATLTIVDSKILLAWISERVTETDEKKRSIKTRLLGATESEEIVVVPEEDDRMPEGLVAAPLGSRDAVIGWVDRSDTTSGVYVLPLDSDGVPKEDPGQLTSFSATSLDIATGDTANAAVYSLNVNGSRQVRFQILAGDGGRASVKDERRLVAFPEEGLDASLVYWGANGFVVSYRGYNSSDTSSAMIRVLVVDLGVDWNPSGLQPQDIAPAALGGGRTTVRLANDGTLSIAWLDVRSANDKTLNLLRRRVR